MDRREFIRTGSMAALGLATARALAFADTESKTDETRSFILIWLNGGPSQLETFDPHAGKKIAGPTRSIKTATSGVEFASGLPRLAEWTNDVAIIRSMISKEGDHERAPYAMRTGYVMDPTVKHPTIGAVAAHELESRGLELPPYISILPAASYAEGGYLGGAWQAYKMGDPLHPPRNLRPRIREARLDRRLAALNLLEARHFQNGTPPSPALRNREQTEQAVRLMRSEQQAAFRVSEEPQAVRDAYGDTPFGRSCLAARRLIETGVRSIEVQLSGWDSHTANFEKHDELCAVLDPALSSLLQDLKGRDLFRKTVVLCAGEFGRTPEINPLNGRDHWPKGFSVLLAGGGIQGGRVHGGTDPEGIKPPSDPVTVADLSATVLTALNIPPTKEFVTSIRRPIKLSEGSPVEAVLRR